MSEQQKQRGLWLTVLISAIIFTAIAGCKKEKEEAKQQPAEQTQTEHQQHERSPDKPLSESTSESAKTETKPAGSVKMSLIIKAAKSWGPGYTSWYDKTAPDFTLTDTAGKQHKLSNYRGRNVFLTFWATWCPACNMEIPHLIALRNSIGEDKLAMLAVSNEDPAKVKKFIAEKNLNYTILLDKGNMPEPFGVKRIYGTTGIPCSFFIDAEGKIKLAAIGVVPLEEIKAIFNHKRLDIQP